MQMLQDETKKDGDLQLLSECLITHDRGTCKKRLPRYSEVFDDLTVINKLVLRGSQIVIPLSLQADVIGLAHEGHQYSDKTLKLLRQTCWFPQALF